MKKNNEHIMFFVILGITLAFLFVACVNDNQEKSPSKSNQFSKLTMKIDNMGYVRYGMAVLRDKPLYTIEFTSKGSMDFFSFDSCSTSISRQNAGGLIFKRKTTKVNFRPNEIEKEKYCHVQIHQTEKKMKKHSSGYIIFDNPRYRLKHKIICGNKTEDSKGSSVCQLPSDHFFKLKLNLFKNIYLYTN